MAILEIGTPSGFMADPSSVKSPSQEPARVEPGDRKVVLYFDEVCILNVIKKSRIAMPLSLAQKYCFKSSALVV